MINIFGHDPWMLKWSKSVHPWQLRFSSLQLSNKRRVCLHELEFRTQSLSPTWIFAVLRQVLALAKSHYTVQHLPSKWIMIISRTLPWLVKQNKVLSSLHYQISQEIELLFHITLWLSCLKIKVCISLWFLYPNTNTGWGIFANPGSTFCILIDI